jgi:RHS repeat-associated protein
MDGQKLKAFNGGAYNVDGTAYRTEIESFNRVIQHGTPAAWFEVHTKAGQIMEFGNTPDSLILAQGTTVARNWALNKVRDTKGNYLTVTYTNDAVNGQAYPSEIDYTGNTAAGVAPYNKVQFVYLSTARPDTMIAYQAGSFIKTNTLLTNVKTYAGASLVADYRLAYQQSASTNASEITSVTLCDAGGNCLPSTRFGSVQPALLPSCPTCGYKKSFAYDWLSRPDQVTIAVNTTGIFNFYAAYDTNNRLSSVTYPSGLINYYVYTPYGYPLAVYGPEGLLWEATAADAELRVTAEAAGNGVVTTQNFDPLTDRLASIVAGASGAVENLSYSYDAIGNVLARADVYLTETLAYDNLNRLTSATAVSNLNSPSGSINIPQKLFTYDPIGNLLSKSDVGTYTYPAAHSPQPHAVSAVTGTINSTFTYDANGNQTSGNGRSTTYTSYNMPLVITAGANTVSFSYDMDHQRFYRYAGGAGTVYMNAFGVHAEAVFSATVTWQDYITGGGRMVAMRAVSGSTVTTRYMHADNLGSISVLTDETGTVVERDGYDAWGKRRFPTGADDPTDSIAGSQVRRGYTGEEFLGIPQLVHLNGRLYDPLIGRMISADPMVPQPMNGQAWNRYSYVVNNPLAFTDPSGYCFLGCGTWQSLGKMQLGSTFRQHPLLGSIVEISAAGICAMMTVGGCEPAIAAVLSSGIVAGVTSGRLGTDVLRAGLTTAATAAAFYVVGGMTNVVADQDFFAAHIQPMPGTAAYAFNVIAHAGVGCGAAVASGAKCGPSALAGAVASAAGPVINGKGFSLGSLAANAALGGGVAVLGGGKFENGAITGAFGYLFNAMAACERERNCMGAEITHADMNIGIASTGGFLAGWAAWTGALKDWLGGLILNNGAGSDGDDTARRPPPGSKTIDKTPWSGDHKDIKGGIGAGPADNVKISPSGDVWGENPDGSWTNHGPAGNFTGSGQPSGRRGKDRDGW